MVQSGRTPKPKPKRDAMQRLDAADGKIDGKYYGRKISSSPSSNRVRSRSAPSVNNLLRPPSRGAGTNEAWEEEYKLLKQQLMDLDRQEQDLGRRHDEREKRYQEELNAIDDRLHSETDVAHDREKKELRMLRERSSGSHHKDLGTLQQISSDKVTAESRLWELREHDLQEQFAFREKELHRLYCQQIQQLQDELAYSQTSGRVHHAVEREHMQPRGGARLGVEIAEWRQAGPGSGEVLKAHPGVKVVNSEGPAAKAGLVPGDVITKISVSTNVGNRLDFKHAMDKVQPGETVLAQVERDGTTQTVAITTDVQGVPLVGFY